MSIFLAILAFALVAAGIIFSVLPPVPGPLAAFFALVATHYVDVSTQFSTTTFIVWGILTVGVLAADYMIPIAATRKFGGTKAGMWGGMIGTIGGLFIPYGIIIGPLVGAVVGDLIGGNRFKAAFKSGMGSFVGFIAATSAKVLLSIIIGVLVTIKVGGFLGHTVMAWFS